MAVRAAVAVLVLVALAAALWWNLAAPGPERPSGAFDVFVVGPTSLLHNGTVTVRDADALSVLQALAERDGFEVRVDDLAGCSYDYVRGVAGHSESDTGGWNYYVRGAGKAAWAWQDHAASCGGLAAGDDVLWCWVEPDEQCAEYP
jgi:hypothetical protein